MELFFIDPETRAIVANQADAEGKPEEHVEAVHRIEAVEALAA
jgi:hypothetical protein